MTSRRIRFLDVWPYVVLFFLHIALVGVQAIVRHPPLIPRSFVLAP